MRYSGSTGTEHPGSKRMDTSTSPPPQRHGLGARPDQPLQYATKWLDNPPAPAAVAATPPHQDGWYFSARGGAERIKLHRVTELGARAVHLHRGER